MYIIRTIKASSGEIKTCRNIYILERDYFIVYSVKRNQVSLLQVLTTLFHLPPSTIFIKFIKYCI